MCFEKIKAYEWVGKAIGQGRRRADQTRSQNKKKIKVIPHARVSLVGDAASTAGKSLGYTAPPPTEARMARMVIRTAVFG